MIVSTRGRYALRMLIDVAEHQAGANVSLKAVAEREGISEKYLESIAKQLVLADIMRSARGKNGGYRLTREPEKITVAQIVHATEGELAAVTCLGRDGIECPRQDSCRTVAVWRGLDDVVDRYLGDITLADVIEPCAPGDDYVI